MSVDSLVGEVICKPDEILWGGDETEGMRSLGMSLRFAPGVEHCARSGPAAADVESHRRERDGLRGRPRRLFAPGSDGGAGQRHAFTDYRRRRPVCPPSWRHCQFRKNFELLN